jgi:hypothetical protein
LSILRNAWYVRWTNIYSHANRFFMHHRLG